VTELPILDETWSGARPLWAVGIKRLCDIIGASLALVVGAPFFWLIALAVLVAQGRPIFYRWDVVGHDGRPFTGWKFRTMVRDADLLRDDLLPHNEMNGPVFKIRRDPRITRVGRFLRRYSLDELPQFWSVLNGDMSLVGPRPSFPFEYERFTPAQRRRLSVKPGLTCLWQVSGRSTVADFEHWIRLDLAYIDEWSLRLDVKIMLNTVPAVLSRRGAW
jgi:lipopolysaccharide/colanic/teichoic acid biosynthesis glycosyltransferase